MTKKKLASRRARHSSGMQMLNSCLYKK